MAAKPEPDPLPHHSAADSFGSAVTAWSRLAAHPGTVRRALLTAIIVGSVLIAINHGSAIISGQVTRSRIIQMFLTVLVPYVVSTVSSVATRRELHPDKH